MPWFQSKDGIWLKGAQSLTDKNMLANTLGCYLNVSGTLYITYFEADGRFVYKKPCITCSLDGFEIRRINNQDSQLSKHLSYMRTKDLKCIESDE
jgi:hypothetical protein